MSENHAIKSISCQK